MIDTIFSTRFPAESVCPPWAAVKTGGMEGIPRTALSGLFTPFFSGKGEHAPPDSSQTRVRGVGLSLAVAHAIVAGCGGRIDVESEEGAGSTFTVRLPPAGGS